MVHILLFGNDPHVDTYDFDALSRTMQERGNEKVYTLGLNRIWKVFRPDFTYFVDGTIALEMKEHGLERQEHEMWVTRPNVAYHMKGWSEELSASVQSYLEENKTRFITPPNTMRSSLIFAIHAFADHIFKGYKCTFYLFGVSLAVNGRHHFWEGDSSVRNKHSVEKMKKNYSKHASRIKRMKNRYRIISCTPGSSLNEFTQSLAVEPHALFSYLRAQYS